MELEFLTKNAKQVEAAAAWIDPTTEEILYGGGKGGGKSYLGASLIFGDALIYPETNYFIARKALNDLRKFTIPTIHEVVKNWGLTFEDYIAFNGQDNIFNLKNGSKVFFIPCDDVPSDPLFERFGSMQMTRGWEEEGGEISETAHRNLSLSIGRWKNDEYGLAPKLLITANPKKGWMKRDFIDPWKQGVLPPSRRFIQALVHDNAAYLPAQYIQRLASEKDTVRRQRLYEGNWDYDEDMDSLVSFDALTDAFSNTIVKENEKYLVVDVARKGKDSTSYAFWEGLELVRLEKRQKQDTAMTAQTVKDFAAAGQIPWSHVLIDEDGIGGGVVDNLPGVKGFIANSTALPTSSEIRSRIHKIENHLVPKTNFANLKSQCGFKLAELINEHKVAFKVPDYREEIIEDLSAMLRHKDADSDGKLQTKPKDKVKEDLGHSPDVGDTLMMRAWFELAREAKNEDPQQAATFAEQRIRMANTRANQSQNSTR